MTLSKLNKVFDLNFYYQTLFGALPLSFKERGWGEVIYLILFCRPVNLQQFFNSGFA